MGNKKSIVQQLQAEAINPDISVSNLLRKAKLVAVKLELKDFLGWVENELNGYNVKTQQELPSYRMVGGEAKAWNPFRGWMPLLFEDPQEATLFSKRGVGSPIGELEGIDKSNVRGTLFVDFSPETKRAITEAIEYATDIKFMVARNSIAGILDAVRNIVLDWSLKLEKEGILGEGLTFSQEEREKAHELHITYNIGPINKFAGVIGKMSGNAKVEIRQINLESEEEVQNLIEQIKRYIPLIDLDVKAKREIKDHIQKLDSEIKSGKPKQPQIKSLLTSIKKILEGAVGNLVARGIIFGIDKIIG
jgi:hypothetical protein